MLEKYWPLLLLLGVGLFSLALMSPGCGDSGSGKDQVTSELTFDDMVEGTGEEAKAGDEVEVHYTGWLASSGQKFDSSQGKEPFQFQLGAGRVIKGWDQGVVGMKVGGKRKLKIPAKLAYGERGAGKSIPPNSDLVFEVELLRIVK
jgi:FKBP-type peptidyl-prolyl cis-trans isomerase